MLQTAEVVIAGLDELHDVSLATDNADAQTFDNQFLILEIHFDGREVRVFGNQPDFAAFTLESLDRHFVANARYHDLAVAGLTGGVHGE